jgi:hypothetical protein
MAWDKRFVGSALQLESRPGGAAVLRGSVIDDDGVPRDREPLKVRARKKGTGTRPPEA